MKVVFFNYKNVQDTFQFIELFFLESEIFLILDYKKGILHKNSTVIDGCILVLDITEITMKLESSTHS